MSLLALCWLGWSCGTTNHFSGTVQLDSALEVGEGARLHVMVVLDQELDRDEVPGPAASAYMHVVEDAPVFPYSFHEQTNHDLGETFAFVAWLESEAQECPGGDCRTIRPASGDFYGVTRALQSDRYSYTADILIDRVLP